MNRPLPMLTPDAKLAEIKRLYYQTTRKTIQEDLAKALDLLKSMANEDERERAAVYMDGLAQMRSDWGLSGKRRKEGGTGRKGKAGRTGGKGGTDKAGRTRR
jgi:hypothetical protein